MTARSGGADVTLDALVGRDAAAVIVANSECVKAFQVARAAGVTTGKARRLLDAAVRAGLMQRSARYSAINCAAWCAVVPNDGLSGGEAVRLKP